MNKSKMYVGGGMILFVLLFCLFGVKIPTIEVCYGNQRFFLTSNDFQLGWIHSVEKEPWFETYEIKGGELYLTTTKFKTFGAGVPTENRIIKSNDGFIHMAVDRKMSEVTVTVSENVKTTLYTHENIIPLYQLIDDYETITVRIVKISLWGRIRGESID